LCVNKSQFVPVIFEPPRILGGSIHTIRKNIKALLISSKEISLEVNSEKTNYIKYEEIKSILKSGNACYHSVQNLLSYSLLSRSVKIKIYRTIILPVVLYGCES
jgi:hypothetical protein